MLNKKGFIYLLKAENGLYKIGTTDNLDKRIRDLWLGNALDLELVHAIWTDNAPALERELQHRYLDCHVKGEWFRLSDTAVAEIKAIEGVDISKVAYKFDNRREFFNPSPKRPNQINTTISPKERKIVNELTAMGYTLHDIVAISIQLMHEKIVGRPAAGPAQSEKKARP